MRAPSAAKDALTRVSGPQSWALFDQAVVSLGSALTSVVLARALPPDQFGVAVLIIAGMLFLNTVHASLVVYPLSIHGARLETDDFRPYVTGSLASTLVLALPLCLLLGGTAGLLVSLSTALCAMLALFTWQFQETARRALFARLCHRAAIPGDLLSYAGQALVVGLLAHSGHLTLPALFLAMSATSVAGGLVQLAILHPRRIAVHSAVTHGVSNAVDGLLPLPSNLLGALIMQAPIWMIALLATRSASGQLQALIAIVSVINPIMFGLGNLLTPAVARAGSVPSEQPARRLLLTSLGHGGLLIAPYVFVLLLWPAQVLGLFYGFGSPFTQLGTSLRLLIAAYLLVFLTHLGNSALFGFERPRDVLNVQLIGAVTLLVVGLPAISAWGLVGAALAAIATHAARALVCGVGLERALRRSRARLVVALEQG